MTRLTRLARLARLAVSSLLVLAACEGSPTRSATTTSDAVVEMVAARDRIARRDAAQHVEDVALLAAAARAAQSTQPDPPPLLTGTRARFLRRAALARVWLRDVFEPEHGLDDIPEDDPIFAAALASPKYVRPRLHMLCQLVAVPSGFADDRDGLLAKADDAQWQALAKARIEPVAERMRRVVRTDDPEACRLMAKLMRFETADDGAVRINVESKAFDLDACSERRVDGSCAQPRFAREWVEQVRQHADPGFIPMFQTRFGYHVVFLAKILPAASKDDPATRSAVREAALVPWRAAALDAELTALRKRWAVKVASSLGDTP